MTDKPQPNLAIVIPGGNPVHLAGTWVHRPTGEERTPSAVRYQVFDHTTREAVSAQVTVPPGELAATMQFSIPGSDLPGPEGTGDLRDRRRLLVKVRADFEAAQGHTEYVDVYVTRELPWA